MNTTYFLNTVAGNLFLSDTSEPLPTEYHLGLSTTAPSADGTGVTEPAATAGYTRVEITDLDVPDDGEVISTEDISFPESTDDWGTVTHFVIFDSATGGNLLIYGPLQKARRLDEGSVLTVRAGDLHLQVFDGVAGIT